MSNNNQLGGQEALNSFLQQQTKHIEGQPIRVYPFKIVSGLTYFTNHGQKPLGSNFGSTYLQNNNTAQTNPSQGLGAYTGITTMFSGSRPIMAYGFGVTNATFANSQCTITINATCENNDPTTWKANMFNNPITNRMEYPGKEVGLVGYSINSSKERHSETLDNLKVGCFETSYDYTVYSNDWVPNFQEINEFVYFIVDIRCACPIALRIETVEPHYDTVGILQDCQITFTSVNQYYNQSGRNVLTYIKFGAVGDGYAFPKEVITNGGVQTYLDFNLLNPSVGGVNQVEVKNNSLTGQFGALVYGHRYQPFQTDKNGVMAKTFEADSYLIPLKFTPPIADKIDVSSEVVHSSYDLMMNMIIVNEQIWDNWKKTREFYNLTQNFTFQGGLSFDDPTSPNTQNVLYGAGDSVLNGNVQYQTYASNLPDRKMLGEGYGSKNLGVVMMSNPNGYSLDYLSLGNSGTLYNSNGSTSITGFAVPTSAIFDYRGTGYTMGTYNKDDIMDDLTNTFTLGLMNTVTNGFDLYYTTGFEPPTNSGNEILSLTNWGANCSSIMPEVGFALNSGSMVCCHQLEVNYRDGICYTNTQQGQNKIWNRIQDIFAGIADYITGYTPGYANFFLDTGTRTYNLLIPHSLAPLCNQYLNPTDNVYNAIPLDIFANTNDNNTSVGQLKYMSGYQFELTDTFQTSTAVPSNVNTRYMRYPTGASIPLTPLEINETGASAKQAILSQSGTNYKTLIPTNSLILFDKPVPAVDTQGNKVSFVIDEINVKQLGISNIHISYYKEVTANNKTTLESVGEEGLENTAKMMNNTSYIDNDIQYYIYDSENITLDDNSSPYVDYQYPFDPVATPAEAKKVASSSQDDYSTGFHFINLVNCPFQGVELTDNTANLNAEPCMTGYGTTNYDQWNVNQGGYGKSQLSGGTTPSTYICYAKNKFNNHSIYTPSSYGITNLDIYSLLCIDTNFTNASDSSFPTSTTFIYPNSNAGGTDECSKCSTTLNKDNYVTGSIEFAEMYGVVGGVQPFPGTSANGTLPNSTVMPSLPSSPDGGGNGVWANIGTYMTGLGTASSYTLQFTYYKFNFQGVIDEAIKYLQTGIPSLSSDSTNSLNWGFVLIPHGTDNPKQFIEDNGQYATASPDACGFVNQKTTLYIIEPNHQSSAVMNTNAVLCSSNYGSTGYQPNYGLDGQGYGGNFNPTPFGSDGEFWQTNPLLNTTNVIATANNGTNNNYTVSTSYGATVLCAPQVPVSFAGLGISCMYQACGGTIPSDQLGSVDPPFENQMAYVKGITPLDKSITIPSFLTKNLSQYTQTDSGSYIQVADGAQMVPQYTWQNTVYSVPTDSVKTYSTYASGKYDLYFVYNVYN